MSTDQVLDYSRSFAINTSAQDGVETNTCRTQFLARCSLRDENGKDRDYFLGKECIGEFMYKDPGIAQVPTSEVCSIFSAEDSSLLKKFANHERDVVQAGEMAIPRKGFDGSYANWTSLRFVQKWCSARPLTSVEEIIEAILAGEPMIGRTFLPTAADGIQAVLEYPIPYINTHPPDNRFQVDVGPVLYPDADSNATMMVERLQLAYVMFNELDHAEFAIRTPTRADDEASAETLHYSTVVKTTARHELFSLGE